MANDVTNTKKSAVIRIDFTKVDPILNANPNMSFKQFQEKNPVKISLWSFYARKAFLKGRPFGSRNKKILADSTNNTSSIVEFVNKLVPNSNRKKEYIQLANILMKNPSTTYAELKQKKSIKLSVCNFYCFRKKIKSYLDQNATSTGNIIQKRKKTLYKLFFEKQIDGFNGNKESLQLLREFIESLNTKKSMGFEIVEVAFPKHAIEIREYSS